LLRPVCGRRREKKDPSIFRFPTPVMTYHLWGSFICFLRPHFQHIPSVFDSRHVPETPFYLLFFVSKEGPRRTPAFFHCLIQRHSIIWLLDAFLLAREKCPPSSGLTPQSFAVHPLFSLIEFTFVDVFPGGFSREPRLLLLGSCAPLCFLFFFPLLLSGIPASFRRGRVSIFTFLVRDFPGLSFFWISTPPPLFFPGFSLSRQSAPLRRKPFSCSFHTPRRFFIRWFFSLDEYHRHF